ncbi:MAG: DUF4359 domain-containing protein [Chitinophagia bacterium]|nr:DUF4359 domain-containing protein [Chitinophagia bacterium]
MKKNIVTFLLIGLIILIAVITNPNEARHKEVVKHELNAYLQKSLNENTSKSDDALENAGRGLGSMFGGMVINSLVDNAVSCQSYVLFSVTNFTWEGKTNTIGVGIFGNVYISDELKKKLKQKIEE